MQYAIEQAAIGHKLVLRHLLELYTYDMSGYEALNVDEHGLYGYRYLDHYWTETGRFAFLLKADGHWAGFALIRSIGEEADGADVYSMAEFFIMKHYRHKGLGERLAVAMFDRFPGKWKVGQMEANVQAQAFWRSVIGSYTNGNYAEIRESGWDGPIQTFISGSRSERAGGGHPAPTPPSARTTETIPAKLKPWDEIRIVAPSKSMSRLLPEHVALAKQRLEQLGLRVTFGKHVMETDAFDSSPVEARIADLHDAFRDPNVKGILAVLGGENCNQLLRRLDYALIRENPKILCGFSDITALGNAIAAKAGLVTYSGPNFSSFAMPEGLSYTREGFVRCLMQDTPFEIRPAAAWSDDPWYRSDAPRTFIPNDGWTVIQPGEATGKIIGGNLCTLNLLQGTEFMPSLDGSVLFVEDDYIVSPETFDRDLQSLIHQPGFEGVKGIVIGRFQIGSRMTPDKLAAIVRSKPELAGIPVIADVDFGHTTPQLTFPIGGTAAIAAPDGEEGAKLTIVDH